MVGVDVAAAAMIDSKKCEVFRIRRGVLISHSPTLQVAAILPLENRQVVRRHRQDNHSDGGLINRTHSDPVSICDQLPSLDCLS